MLRLLSNVPMYLRSLKEPKIHDIWVQVLFGFMRSGSVRILVHFFIFGFSFSLFLLDAGSFPSPTTVGIIQRRFG